jgi:hypothetical protein
MAPLSYYWLISFIYLVIAKREISEFLEIKYTHQIYTRLIGSVRFFNFSIQYPLP